MRKIWSDERKFQIWLEIEVLACEAMAQLGQIPKNDAEQIRKCARFSIPEILEIEKRTNHDVIAFLENVADAVGSAARWIHQGLTSSDILDTRSEEHTSELQSLAYLVCRLLLPRPPRSTLFPYTTLFRSGQIPKNDAEQIRKCARFSIPEILEIEKRTNHDVIAFLENVADAVGSAARWIHQGLTSSDILDTTLAVQLNESCDILLADLKSLRTVIADQARRFKMTPMIGRSHGVHAEPITFGLKLALMYDEFGRAEERLTQTRERIRVGKISGAVGTHAHVDPKIERAVCEKLGLKPATLSTQIVQRDRHGEFMTTLAVIASSIDRWATEFRHLQRTEVLEVEEFFGEGQKGSSAMPHKRNPITGERLSGLARVVRGNAVVALENVALWHERDISHSSAERIILPDSCIL